MRPFGGRGEEGEGNSKAASSLCCTLSKEGTVGASSIDPKVSQKPSAPSVWFLRAKPVCTNSAAEEGAFALRVRALWRPHVFHYSPTVASPRVLLTLID